MIRQKQSQQSVTQWLLSIQDVAAGYNPLKHVQAPIPTQSLPAQVQNVTETTQSQYPLLAQVPLTVVVLVSKETLPPHRHHHLHHPQEVVHQVEGDQQVLIRQHLNLLVMTVVGHVGSTTPAIVRVSPSQVATYAAEQARVGDTHILTSMRGSRVMGVQTTTHRSLNQNQIINLPTRIAQKADIIASH